MKVEIWSDFVCPFCFIGKTHFEKALSQFEHRNQIETIFKSFELDPHVDSSKKERTSEVIARKYGITIEQARGMSEQIAEQARQVGLVFRFDNLLSVNTFDAHRLMLFAQGKQLGEAFTHKAFVAYFTDNKDISDHEVLLQIANDAGLNVDEAKQVLKSDQFSSSVRTDEQEANQLGVRGVPFFVIDRKYAISGAQPVQVFLDTLNKAWKEANPGLKLVADDYNSQGQACGVEGCD